MSRKVYLANYFSSEDKVTLRRSHLLWKMSRGWNVKNSALAVEISYFYAKQIIIQKL